MDQNKNGAALHYQNQLNCSATMVDYSKEKKNQIIMIKIMPSARIAVSSKSSSCFILIEKLEFIAALSERFAERPLHKMMMRNRTSLPLET